ERAVAAGYYARRCGRAVAPVYRRAQVPCISDRIDIAEHRGDRCLARIGRHHQALSGQQIAFADRRSADGIRRAAARVGDRSAYRERTLVGVEVAALDLEAV